MDKRYRNELEALPPPEIRLYDPLNNKNHDRIPTPINDIGLVDEESLITAVKETIDPSYEWPFKLSKHHFYWEEELYPYQQNIYGNLGAFRNLPVHKGIFIRSFENWLHVLTEKPPIPDPDVRQYRIEAWSVADDLFRMATKTIESYEWDEMRRISNLLYPDTISDPSDPSDPIGQEYIARKFERNFRGFDFQMGRNEKIPPELRVIHLDQGPENIVQQLGRVVSRRGVNFVPKIQALRAA